MSSVRKLAQLGQVGLAEDDRAGRAQPGDDRRVAGPAPVLEREGTGGGRQPGHVDVVLDQDRDALDRAARTVLAAVRSLASAWSSASRREATDRPEGGVEAGDVGQVRLDDGAAGEGAGVKRGSQLGDRDTVAARSRGTVGAYQCRWIPPLVDIVARQWPGGCGSAATPRRPARPGPRSVGDVGRPGQVLARVGGRRCVERPGPQGPRGTP